MTVSEGSGVSADCPLLIKPHVIELQPICLVRDASR